MWTIEIPIILRYMINDLSDPPTYTDGRLETLFLVSAQLVQSDIGFSTTYTINIPNTGISPDPTETASRDDTFINLTCLKAACVLGRGEAKVAAGQAIDIRDGQSSISLKGIGTSKLAISNNYCKDFEDAKFEYMMTGGNYGGVVPGEFIVGPFKVYAHESYLYSDYTNRFNY